MSTPSTDTSQYDTAAPQWGDRMRALGYYDGYLGFLSDPEIGARPAERVIDIGAGTAAFAEAWDAIHGAGETITLLEPSQAMLDRASKALARRNVEAAHAKGLLGNVKIAQSDVALAAHVIEHCPDPLVALQEMHALLRPGGRLFLAVSKPHWCNAIIWLQWRHRTFRYDEISQLLAQAGFEVDGRYAFPSGPPSRTSFGVAATRLD